MAHVTFKKSRLIAPTNETPVSDKNLTELVYRSVTPEAMRPTDVRDLLHHAREKNARLGVTGLLCYDGREFLQIIEGQSGIILDLFHQIQNDARHVSVEILHDGDIDMRAFSDWKMAYESIPMNMLPTLGRSIAKASLAAAMKGETKMPVSAGQRIFDLFMDEIYGGEKSAALPVPA